LQFAAFCLVLVCPVGIAMAQDSLSNATPRASTPLPNPAGTVGTAPLGGGGSMADFSTLMMLIEQTVDPEGWLAAGGRSTQIPYPQGVYVDPRGHLA
jgi:hypothetical protein